VPDAIGGEIAQKQRHYRPLCAANNSNFCQFGSIIILQKSAISFDLITPCGGLLNKVK
jgi:hypothetical protein